MRNTLLLGALLLGASLATAQPLGSVAFSEGVLAPMVNPAVFSRWNGLYGGLWTEMLADEPSGQTGFTLRGFVGTNFPLFGQLVTEFEIDDTDGFLYYHYSSGWKSFSVSATLKNRVPGQATEGVGFSAWLNPFSWLALGGRLDFQRLGGSWQFDRAVYGVALRPLAWVGLTDELEMAVDVVSTWDEPLALDSVAVNLGPLPGVVLHGGYQHGSSPRFHAGLTLRFAYGDIGGSGLVANQALDRASAWVGFQIQPERRALLSPPRLVFFENSDTISETIPRLVFFPDMPGVVPGQIQLSAFLQKVDEARRDPFVKALVFLDQDFLATWDQILTLRAALKEFKSSGKKIYFYAESVSLPAYLAMAGIADRISMNASGVLDLKVPYNLGLYLGNFLKKYGIEFRNFASHPDKTAGNFLSEGAPTTAEQAQWERVLRNRRQIVLEILRSRSLIVDPERAMANGPWIGQDPELERLRLVDALESRGEFLDRLDKEFGDYDKINEFTEFRDRSWRGFEFGTNIAVVYAFGEILNDSRNPLQITPDELLGRLRAALMDLGTAGVILRVDSPGGTIIASEEIGRGIVALRRQFPHKPIWVSMGAVAASGGYFISAPAARIFASEATITGSIGVIYGAFQLEKLLQEQQINPALRGSTQRPLEPNPLLPLTPPIAEKVASDVQHLYRRFASWVQEHRKLSAEELDRAAQARIWTGREALDLKLVDQLGDLTDAIAALARERGLSTYRVVEYNPTFLPDLADSVTGLARNAVREVFREELGLGLALEPIQRLRQLMRESAYLYFSPEGADR